MISFITWNKFSTPLTRSSYSITEELFVGWERRLAADIKLECALSKDMLSDVESDDKYASDGRSVIN